MSLCHVVLTRFAVRTGVQSQTPSAQWLQQRCSIFERFCLPSVTAQGQGFDWLLFYDSSIPARWQDVILGYGESWPAIVPVAVDKPWDPGIARDAAWSRMPSGCDVLMTTRLDNDDAISVDYVSRLKEVASSGFRGAVVFDWGFTLADSKVYLQPLLRGPFASMIVDVDRKRGLRTVYDYEHEALDDVMPVRHLGCPCAWLQVVHGENLANKVRGVRVPRRVLRSRFAAPWATSNAEPAGPLLADMLLTGARFAVGLVGRERRSKAFRFLSSRAVGLGRTHRS